MQYTKYHQKFLKIRATDDITFEDPLERIDGIDNVGHFFSMCKYLELFEFKVHKEIHSAHEILLDWELSVCIFWLKYLVLEYQSLTWCAKCIWCMYSELKKESKIFVNRGDERRLL